MPASSLLELELIQAIADGLPVGILVLCAPDAEFTYANRAFSEILGTEPLPAVKVGSYGKAYRLYRRDGAPYPEDQLLFPRTMREKKDVVVDDVVVHREDGRKVYLRAFARPLWNVGRDGTSGGSSSLTTPEAGPPDVPSPGAARLITHVVITLTDITPEVETRSRAQLAERHLEHVLDHAPLILFAFDRKGVVTLSEGRGLSALGFAPKELIGRSVFELYANDPVSLANADRALTGEEFTVESTLGPDVALETTFTPVKNEEGEVVGVIGVSIEITERIKMQSRLLKAERLASMGTLSASVAHEINNPLSYVLGNLDLALTELSDPATVVPKAREVLEWVKLARDGAGRVARIVRGLKAFARQDDERAEPTDVRAALERALDMADNAIRHRARLVRRIEDVPPVFASELRLSQVFVNLLLNAAQAIPEGHRDANEIRVAAWHDESKSSVVVTVEDTGSGMPKEVKDRVFEPFFTTKPIGVGTGLGLSICYGIVHGLGGTIEVDSRAGEGTTIRVRIPASGRARRAPSPAVAVEPPTRRGRILIIDDNVNVARSFAILLADHDVEVSVDPRRAANRILAGETFDIVFCDLMMPAMTGMDLHAAVAEKLPKQAERIVFVTGGAFTPAAQEFVSRVPNTVLEKPFDMKKLAEVLARGLADKHRL